MNSRLEELRQAAIRLFQLISRTDLLTLEASYILLLITDKLHKHATSDHWIKIGTWMSRTACAVHFRRSNAGHSNVWPFCALDRAVAVPNARWRAIKGLARRNDSSKKKKLSKSSLRANPADGQFPSQGGLFIHSSKNAINFGIARSRGKAMNPKSTVKMAIAAALIALSSTARAESVEANTVACPNWVGQPVRALFDQLQLGITKIDQPTGMAVKITRTYDGEPRPYHTGAQGFVANILLPTITIRDVLFSGSQTDGYSGPIRRYRACGVVFVVSSQWGHPYIQNGITIEVLSGAAADL